MIPDNPNGRWIWKTEFFTAFEKSEVELCKMGYTRVYYQISDKYGSFKAVRLMRRFHDYVVEKYNLCKKANLFGFSRGGLYAFNYALFYPDKVEKVYLDAPVLDLKSWPPEGTIGYDQMIKEYSLDKETLKDFGGIPLANLKEYFSYKIPTLIVAGDSDQTVPFDENGKIMIDYALNNGIDIKYFVKKRVRSSSALFRRRKTYYRFYRSIKITPILLRRYFLNCVSQRLIKKTAHPFLTQFARAVSRQVTTPKRPYGTRTSLLSAAISLS